MKLTSIRIQNFRSFSDETIPLNSYNCFVGPNGSGKSAVLCALNIFFREQENSATNTTQLKNEDFHLCDTDTRNAEKRPASTTADVPWMSSLKTQKRSRYFCSRGKAE